MEDLIVIGGGEFARVVIETVRGMGVWNVLGFLDPEPCVETVRRLNVQRLGADSQLRQWPGARLALGVGGVGVSSARKSVVARIGGAPDRWIRIEDTLASVSPTALIAPGAIILAGAVVCSGAWIGRHAIINIGAMVDHDVRVGEFTHVGPKASLGGGSTVGHNTFVGMGAMIRDHTTVADDTTVGMGAAVTKSFPAGSTLVGVPARAI